MKELEIGIIGFGTVGAGVADCLLKNGEVIAKRTGVKPVIKKIADLDIVRDRGVKVPDGVLTTDAMEAIETCQVIVELVGGTTFAKTIILEALKRGTPPIRLCLPNTARSCSPKRRNPARIFSTKPASGAESRSSRVCARDSWATGSTGSTESSTEPAIIS